MVWDRCRAGLLLVMLNIWQLASGSIVLAQQTSSPEANALFVSAVQDYRATLVRKPDAGREDLRSVRDLIFRILSEYPESIPATELLKSQNPAGLDLVRILLSPVPGNEVELNEGRRALARDLLEAYDGNLYYLGAVAEAAPYAVLAWAAYGKEEALAKAAELGWVPEPTFPSDLLTIQAATATLFMGPNGRHVLAFPGTRDIGAGFASDWFTNTVGTVTPLRLTEDQVADSIEIARRVSARFPDVEFAGHSLGGRFAHLAALETGNSAFLFNSAPLGLAERTELGLDRLLGTRTVADLGPILRFRSPDDPLTELASKGDPIVRNFELIGEVAGDSTGLAILNHDYAHAIEPLAAAMLEVRTARDEGWLAAYLYEQAETGGDADEPDALAWPATMTPHFRLAPGQSRDGMVVGTDGSLTVAGTVVFPAAEAPTKVEIHVYPSPISGHRAVIQRNLDRTGLRAAVLSDEASPDLIVSVVPEDMVEGYGRERAAYHVLDGTAWSPDGKFLAIQLAIEGQVSLLLVELSTGSATVAHPDEGGLDAAVAIDELRYDEEFGSRDQLKAPFRRYRCVGDGCLQREIISEVSITFDVAGAIANNPWPTIRADEAGQRQDQKWGPEIVAPEGFDPAQNSCDAMENAACLRTAGFSEPAIDFIEALGESAAGGIVRSFEELDQVDLVELELSHSPWRTYLFVNGVPSEIFVSIPNPAFPESHGDRASKSVLAGVDPMGGGWGNIEVVSHRQRPGRGQRFVATLPVTSGCRACPIVGIAVRQFDFDAKGKLVAETTLGLMDWRGRQLTQQYEGAAVLRDEALAQFLLNIRGYDAGPMDGNFGARSRIALATFQTEHCLPTTKIVDRATADALATNDFFSNACEDGQAVASTETADAAPVIAQTSGPDQSADCAVIENDIARLECYDAVAKGGGAESVQSQAAFGQPEVARLEALLSFGVFRATVDLSACTILVRDTRALQTSGDFASGGWSDWLGSTSNGVRTVGERRDVVTFPLGSLDIRQTQPSESDGLSVVTESDALITRSRESEDYATGRIERESKTFRSYLLYTSSPYDALPVYELLSAADLACRQYGE